LVSSLAFQKPSTPTHLTMIKKIIAVLACVIVISAIIASWYAVFLLAERRYNYQTIEAHSEYYRNLGATDFFWKKVRTSIFRYKEEAGPNVYHYKVCISSDEEDPRYLYLGYMTEGKFVPKLIPSFR
jgi:hypothetical protein